MKNRISTVLLFFILTILDAQAQTSIKDAMCLVHGMYGVNFIYDSSLDLDAGTSFVPVPDMKLETVMEELFYDSGIKWEINSKYVVLTADGKKPKNYTIFIEETVQDTLAESRILALKDRRTNSTQTGLEKIDARNIDNGFAVLSAPDVIKTLQNMTGVASGMEMMTGLYVHGGTGRDNLFIIDGVPMYQTGHLAGIFSPFNTEVIDNVDFYKSGFPARYGGRLSSVVDISTRRGDMHDYKGAFSIGLLNGSLQFEGPIIPGRTSFNLALRHSWLDLFTIPVFAVLNSSRREKAGKTLSDMRYALADINASVTHAFSTDNILSFNFYSGRDVLRYMVRYPSGNSEDYDIDVRWGNILGSVNWSNRLSDRLHTEVIGYYTRNLSSVSYELSKPGSWSTDENSDAYLNDAGLKADVDYTPSSAHHVRTGVSYIFHFTDVSRRFRTENMYEDEEPYADSGYVVRQTPTHELSVYAEDEIAVTDWLKANVGLRYSAYLSSDVTYGSLEPRASLRFQCGSMTALKLSYAEMSQYQHYVSFMFIDFPTGTWYPSTARHGPMRSRQMAAGIYVSLPCRVVANLEGYWKDMSGILEYCGNGSFYPSVADWEDDFVSGQGRAYGMELSASYSAERLSVSAAYTLSWTERRYPQFWDGWYPDRYDNRHKLDVSATYGFNDRAEIYAGWHYHSGNRLTLPEQSLPGKYEYVGNTEWSYYDDKWLRFEPNNVSLPDYHRLDIGANFRKTTRRGNTSIWNVSIYNAYCRMNPFFAEIDQESDGRRYVKAFAIFPVIPSFSYTLRF